MPTIQGEFTVIHDSTQVDFDNFSYGGFVIIDNASCGGSVTINGTTWTPPNEWDGQLQDMTICREGTILNACVLYYGNPLPPNLCAQSGLLSGVTATANAVYQFQDIKSGNMIKQ